MKWNGLNADKQWAGLDNYRYVLNDDTGVLGARSGTR